MAHQPLTETATATITSHITVPGLHYWPDAPDRRAYLRALHRHLFHITATLEVDHDDRAIEYHDLQAALTHATHSIGAPYEPDTSLWHYGPASCEHIARRTAQTLSHADLHPLTVTVSEDGENTATLHLPTPTDA